MKIQLASDLHIDFQQSADYLKKNPLPAVGEVLVLAGDVVPHSILPKHTWFFQHIDQSFKLVLIVPGNHEFYHSSIEGAYPDFLEKAGESIVHLNNQVVVYKRTRFIATTLWTNIPESYQYEMRSVMNDYKYIYKDLSKKRSLLSPKDTLLYHQMSVRFLQKELAKPFDGSTVVISHHAPLLECYGDNDHFGGLKHAYGSDLSELMEKYNIQAWLFGHIHKSCDKVYHGTRVVSNPLGYPGEEQNEYFDPRLVIEV